MKKYHQRITMITFEKVTQEVNPSYKAEQFQFYAFTTFAAALLNMFSRETSHGSLDKNSFLHL